MNRTYLLLFVSILLFLTVGCKKDSNFISNNTAAVVVVNGVIGLPSLMLKMDGKLNTSGFATSNISKLNFGNAAFFYAQRQNTAVDILNGIDTSKLTSTTYNFGSNNNGLYSLFITGMSSSSIETVLVEENSYPYIQLDKIPANADSLINIRFVNLAPDVPAINVKISGNTSNETSGLNYKSASAFKAYVAKATNPNYKFEFRNAITNDSLTAVTFTINANNRFKNVALVLRGLKTPGTGQPALAVSTVNYFQ